MHEPFIRRCLKLARSGQGETGINPLVGALLVRDGIIIAEGFHAAFGKPHAERQLLEKCEQDIRPTDTLYVNLEPCCHGNKKTLPCVPLIIGRGVKRLVFGMLDPNPSVAGKGITMLRKAGIEVIGPVLPEECARLNRGFVSLMTRGRPWITLHRAQTRSGRVAQPDDSPLKITSPEQDTWSHAFLRARHDAVLVGIGTVLSDDPQLTVRYMDHPPEIIRIILDAELRIPLKAQVVNSSLASRTIIIRKETEESEEYEEKVRRLRGKGALVITCPYSNGTFDWSKLWSILTEPKGDFHGIKSILVEGGVKTWEIFRRANLVDEEVTLVGD